MWMGTELGWTAQLERFMFEPFSLCCSPRAKLVVQTEERPEERGANSGNRLGAEPAKLKVTRDSISSLKAQSSF